MILWGQLSKLMEYYNFPWNTIPNDAKPKSSLQHGVKGAMHMFATSLRQQKVQKVWKTQKMCLFSPRSPMGHTAVEQCRCERVEGSCRGSAARGLRQPVNLTIAPPVRLPGNPAGLAASN
ncbi:hypothetical protein AOLI_G00219920 [Acnodon oligacanthus]